LERDGAADFGFWTAGELSVGAVGVELSVGDRLYRLRSGEAGFAGELLIFVRGGTAFLTIHIGDASFGKN
jgi:hypothetical protein